MHFPRGNMPRGAVILLLPLLFALPAAAQVP